MSIIEWWGVIFVAVMLLMIIHYNVNKVSSQTQRIIDRTFGLINCLGDDITIQERKMILESLSTLIHIERMTGRNCTGYRSLVGELARVILHTIETSVSRKRIQGSVADDLVVGFS